MSEIEKKFTVEEIIIAINTLDRTDLARLSLEMLKINKAISKKVVEMMITGEIKWVKLIE